MKVPLVKLCSHSFEFDIYVNCFGGGVIWEGCIMSVAVKVFIKISLHTSLHYPDCKFGPIVHVMMPLTGIAVHSL